MKILLYIYKGKKDYDYVVKKGEKMSFDVNVLSSRPVIKPAASMQNDGGGGNLGYMAQGRKKEEKDKKYLEESIFMQKEYSDLFGVNKPLELPKEKSIIEKIVEFIKNLLKQ